ncbi:hypothetical protein FQN54_006566 [Arachnomyces sp. PD_36]|nr:hypothetical protein FQN54_006566 [Arachnomyces sp. PD_36]
MGAAFANIIGDSNTEYCGDSMDDALLGCVDPQNVTMHVGDLSVVYSDGRVKARPKVEPIVWTLSSYPSSNNRAWHIYHTTPFGAQISWDSPTSEKAIVHTRPSYNSKMQIKYAASTIASPRVIVAREGRCIRFNGEGNAEVRMELLWQPLSMRIVAKRFEWNYSADKNNCP